MSEPVLRTESLTKRFGGLIAINNLSLSLAARRLHAIIGPNGAGKTTLFNLVSGLLPPSEGHVFFEGRDITGLKPHQISRLGIKRTLQIKSVFPQLTVAENLWITGQAGRGFLHPFRAATSDRQMRETVERTLAQIGLSSLSGRQAGTLSYGDVALLEIGMAVISQPRLLLLDEPTCGMSPAETERTVSKIRELSRAVDIVTTRYGGGVRDRRRYHRDGAGRDPCPREPNRDCCPRTRA
jgi:branched-chain amino acid transport system ATP-binding protein